MAITRFLIALFAALTSLAFAGAASDCTKSCWARAVEVALCNGEPDPTFCACRSFGGFEIFNQCHELCVQSGGFKSLSFQQICENVGPADDEAAKRAAGQEAGITALAARTPVPDPYTITLKTWSTIGFCGLPGTFCSFEDDDDVPVNNGATITSAAALAARTPVPDPYTITLKTWSTIGFCGLPGMFCAEEEIADERANIDAPQSVSVPSATPSRDRHYPQPQLSTPTDSVSLPTPRLPDVTPDKRAINNDGSLPLRETTSFMKAADSGTTISLPAATWKVILVVVGVFGALAMI